jgi:uncharacterized repeat protein (TIGR01451 family)
MKKSLHLIAIFICFFSFKTQAQVSITQNIVQALACGSSINVVAIGSGTIQYYSIDSINGLIALGTSCNITPSMAGIYTIIATNGIDSATVIDNLYPVMPKIDSIKVVPSLCTITAQVKVFCNTNYTYTITGTGGLAYAVNSVFTAPALTYNQTYTVTITDACGATVSKSFIVPFSFNNLQATIQTTSSPCIPGTGSCMAVCAGGTLPYSYAWNTIPVQTTTTASGLDSGIYTVIVTDANGCTRNRNILLNKKHIIASATKDTICVGDSTILTSNIMGLNSGSLPTNYQTANFGQPVDDEILSFSFGSFVNNTGCGITGVGAINGLPASQVGRYSNHTNLFISPVAPGSTIPISIKIGYCPFIATYSNTATIYIDFNRDGDFTDLNEMVYTKPFGTSAMAGTTYFGNIIIPSNALLGNTLMRIVLNEATTAPSQGSYSWGETEDYIINIGQATQNTTTWYPNVGLNTNTGNQVVATPTVTTTYTVVNTDPILCNDTAIITIVINELFYSSISLVHTNTDCPNSNNGQIAAAETPLTNSLTYQWSNGKTGAIDTLLSQGQYSVLVKDSLGGCKTFYDSITVIGAYCNNINGKVTWDFNKNCIFESGEEGIKNEMITLNPGAINTFTDAFGNYQFSSLANNTYTVTKNNNLLDFGNNCNTTTNVTLSSNSAIIDFMDTVKTIFTNVDYVIYQQLGICVNPNLGIQAKQLVYYLNGLTLPTTATIYLILDSNMSLVSSTPIPTFISGDTMFWNVSNISNVPNSILFQFSLTPNLGFGISLPCNFGIINTLYNDSNLLNNQYVFPFSTCISFDPNIKTVYPTGKTSSGYITKQDDVLSYDVHFQNVGNATAANVIIVDTIDSNLDITTFQVQNYSHPYQIELINNHIFKFKFLGIMLPDSGANFDASQGFITYTIKQKNTNTTGDVINNTAYIYFDYNAAVITNTTTNTIYEKLKIDTITKTNNTNCNTTVCGNATATISHHGGIGPFTISVTPMCSSTIITGNVIHNLTNGVYTISVSDAIDNTVTSIIFIQLDSAVNTIISNTICANQTPFIWHGQVLISSGAYNHTYTSTSGCDSILTLNLMVTPTITHASNVSVCSNQTPYLWQGQSITNTGAYAHTFLNANGCDSIATINVTVKQASAHTTSVSVCNYQLPFLWHGQNLNTTGLYYYTTTNTIGCDSIETLNFVVKNATFSTTNLAICTNQLPYLWNAQTINNAGTYTKHFNNAAGCDSTATLLLTINPTFSHNIISDVCVGSNYTCLDGTTLQNVQLNSLHTNHFSTIYTCDSTIYQAINVLPIDTSVSALGNQLTANQTSGTYQWIDCNSKILLANGNTQAYNVLQNGSYAVIVTNGNCTDTSSCYTFNSVGLGKNVVKNNTIKIFPNPAKNILNIQSSKPLHQIKIINMLGETVLIINANEALSTQINIENLSNGVYQVQINEGVYELKIVN